MVHFVFDSEETAIRFGEAVDLALGYPKKGTNVGGGIHAPEELTITRSFFGPPRKHPTRDEWAFPFADEVSALVQSTPALGEGMRPIELDASWRPPMPEFEIPPAEPHEPEPDPVEPVS